MRGAIELVRTMHDVAWEGGAPMIDAPPSPGMCLLDAFQERDAAAAGIPLETFGY